jgi:putative exporter of polyketide antibiotics
VKENIMSQINIEREFRKTESEALLPVEKRLIGWSLGIGLVLLVVLAIVNHMFPASI